MNPEFRRQLWLHWSTARLIAAPALLLLLGLLAVSIDPHSKTEALQWFFSSLLGGVLYIWASFTVLESLQEEVRESTWNQQRLSSLSPWQMAWGKLLGAGSYVWYVALLCAAVLCSTYWLETPADGALSPAGKSLLLLASMLGALGVQALVLAARLFTLPPHPRPQDTLSGVQVFAALLGLLWLGFGLFGLARELILQGGETGERWWGLRMSATNMAFLLAGSTLLLGLLALWRSMCTQLMVRTLPWAWPLGWGVVVLVVGGFHHPNPLDTLPLYVAGAFLLATVFSLLGESNSRLHWHGLLWQARQGHWRRALQALPLWPISWALALAGALWLQLSLWPTDWPLAQFMLMLTLHVLRNAMIYLWFTWAPRRRAPLPLTMLTVIVLAIMASMLKGFNLAPLSIWFEPLMSWQGSTQGPSTLGWLAMALHLLLAAAALLWRWRQTAHISPET